MINVVFDGSREIKKREGIYLVRTPDRLVHEADTLKEMTAVICGLEYLDCEAAETEWIMRMKAGRWLAMTAMMEKELAEGFLGEEDEEQDSIILWDVRHGRIPQSFVHTPNPATPDAVRIHVEDHDIFIYSLFLAGLIGVWEKNDSGKYVSWDEQMEQIQKQLLKSLEPFEKIAMRMKENDSGLE